MLTFPQVLKSLTSLCWENWPPGEGWHSWMGSGLEFVLCSWSHWPHWRWAAHSRTVPGEGVERWVEKSSMHCPCGFQSHSDWNSNSSLEFRTKEGGAGVVSGFLQLPLPRCDPSTALGLPLALQVGDRSLGRQSREVVDENCSSVQVQMENIPRLIFPSKFEIIIMMN